MTLRLPWEVLLRHYCFGLVARTVTIIPMKFSQCDQVLISMCVTDIKSWWLVRNVYGTGPTSVMSHQTPQIAGNSIVCSIYRSTLQLRKHPNPKLLVLFRGMEWLSVDCPHKWSIMRKAFPWRQFHATQIYKQIYCSHVSNDHISRVIHLCVHNACLYRILFNGHSITEKVIMRLWRHKKLRCQKAGEKFLT